MADARRMAAGAASGTVTAGLALFLVLMSQRPEPAPAQSPPPEPVPEQVQQSELPSQAAVRLPPPPALSAPRAVNASAPPKPIAARTPEDEAEPPVEPQMTPLKPRAAAPEQPIAEIMPRVPRKPVEIVEPRPRPAPGPARVAAPAAPATPASAAVAALPPQPTPPTEESVAEGRALLRMLEAGKGPLIEIAWPADPRTRAKLYDTLRHCHGMQTALLREGGALYVAGGAAGVPSDVNRDAISGFVRRPAGALPGNEREVIADLVRRHGQPGAAPVRLFPRPVDAALLGGLRAIVGEDYAGRRVIRARYRLEGRRVTVEDISADGRALTGRIALPPTRRGCG